MTLNFPWYGHVTDNSLEQGDFFFTCQVLEQLRITPSNPGDKYHVTGNVSEYDVVILSQSCDLTQGKIETVLVCPHWTIEEFETIEPDINIRGYKEKIRQGNLAGYHMLASCQLPNFISPIRIVSFRQVFGLPLDYIQDITSNQNTRLRLLPPYREHLAQAFARFIMRVGLPVDIPAFSK